MKDLEWLRTGAQPRFDPNFRDCDGLSAFDVSQFRASEADRALSEAMRLSLVKRAKSPTCSKKPTRERDLSTYEPIVEIEATPDVFEATANGAGLFTVIQHREWSDEYRIRTRVETSLSTPPVRSGPLVSNFLTSAAARKITESCYFMAEKHKGFKTFVTGTFKPETRAAIAAGETTIQREVSRTMDALQKMYLRGWQGTDGEKHAGHDSTLKYCWVVEIPKNEQGEENPHVHFMVDWRVKKKHFTEWAARIESIWGHGYFHLEKIKDPLCAGAYMAKAAGYLTKGKQEDQGRVKGNRYGISKNARAPGWFTIQETELNVMGKLIAEMNEMMMAKYGQTYGAREHLKRELENCPKSDKKRRLKIGRSLQKLRTKINNIQIVASKYQIILKGKKAFSWFIGWAMGAGWKPNNRPNTIWLDRFNKRLQARRDRRQIETHRWSDIEFMQALKGYAQHITGNQAETCPDDWAQYEGMDYA